MEKPKACCHECDGAVVVGGGIAGLAASLSLSKIAGIQHIHIIEKASQIEFESEEQGAALILGPNGLKAIRALGGDATMQRVLSEGSHIFGNVILHDNNHDHENDYHSVEEDKTLEITGLPQVLIRWGVLRSILRNLVVETDGIDILANAEASNYRLCDNGRLQILNLKDEVIHFDQDDNGTPLIVAADGIDSRFSRIIHPMKNIKDNGRVNIKAVVKKSLPNKNGLTYSYFNGSAACFSGPAGNSYTYWAISLLPKDNDSDYTCLEKVKHKLLETLTRMQAPLFIIELIQATPSGHIFVRQSQESIHVQKFHSPNNVALVGDAAHAMSPSYGQCGSMALEDAVTLGSCIKTEQTLKDALEKYSNARMTRTEEMVQRSAERTKKAVKGEPAEDISQWIYQWEPPCE